MPDTKQIKAIFEEQIDSMNGTVTDAFDDGSILYLRSVLPQADEVRKGDALRAGVALRADDTEALVHPYTFRLVCSNGAIVAQALETRRIEIDANAPEWELQQAHDQIREAVCACAEPEVFTRQIGQLRTAAEQQADVILNLLPFLRRMPIHSAAQLVQSIRSRFEAEGDRTTYGLMNAVTSTARDTRDPHLRWQLEEIGATIPAQLLRSRLDVRKQDLAVLA